MRGKTLNRDIRNALLSPTGSIQNGIACIEASPHKIILVADTEGKLLGTATDGDIRRGILRGVNLSAPIADVMNRHPLSARFGAPRDKYVSLMRKHKVRHLPLLDERDILVGIETLIGTESHDLKDHWVVLMAGGIGSRLVPLTNNLPKPLLKVGNKPVLETIVERFVGHGFHKLFISVNYKAEMLKAHFGDGSAWEAEIRYLEENEPLGTAGALALLPDRAPEPIVVMNGDILTRVNFEHLIEFHIDNGAAATMCIREYDIEVPFGVVDMETYRVNSIVEKPVHRVYVNAGIYVLNPKVIDRIPAGTYYDMPTLLNRLNKDGMEVAAFPIQEYWIDIGQMEDLARAEDEFVEAFK